MDFINSIYILPFLLNLIKTGKLILTKFQLMALTFRVYLAEHFDILFAFF